MKHEYKVHWATGRRSRVYCGIPYNTNFPITEDWETVTCAQCLKRRDVHAAKMPSLAQH